MATPCSNCVYKGTKYCAIFCGRVLRKLLSVNVPTLVMALAVTISCNYSWGSCQYYNRDTRCDSMGSNNTNQCANTPLGQGGCKACDYIPDVCNREGWACVQNPTNGCRISYGSCYGFVDIYVCSTQAEADSAKCANYPTAEGCVVKTDTTLFACTDNISGNGGLYRLSCKAENGVVTSCNGKTNVDIATDGTLVRPLQGTCAQNGFGTGVIGGATSDSTAPQSANAGCFAVMGSTCHMKDKASGNTFRCECDGSCNVALRNLMAGNADCTNPYEQPEQNDSLDLPLSSPSSSGSGEGSSPSSSPSGEGNSSDFEYDYTEVLEAIQANTQQTATELGRSNEFLNNIQNNTETANSLLQAIANKDWSPNINVSAPNVNVQGDTNIINVEVSGDTALAPREILEFLRDTSGIGGYAGQFENEKAQALAWADSVHASAVAFADSISGVEVPDMSDSLGSAVQGVSGALRTLKDTLDNSAISDSMDRWADLITDNGVITGDGSNDCPDILTQTYSWGFTIAGTTINVPVGSLGEFVCNPISPFGITIWAFCRVILRAIVAIGCMFWIYRAVLGIDNSGGDD